MTETLYQLWTKATGFIYSLITATQDLFAIWSGQLQPEPTWQELSEQNKEMLRLWQTSNECSTVVIAIQVHTLERDKNRITEIGLSAWRITNNSEIQSFSWRVKENTESKYKRSTEAINQFAFGESHSISEKNIGLILDGELRWWITHHERICVVGHGVSSALEVLNRHWRLPEHSLVLDTQAIWQYQNRETDGVSLEECLGKMPHIGFNPLLLGNAGNESKCIAYLFAALGQHVEFADKQNVFL